MIKKIIIAVALVGLVGAGYVYMQSQQKPTDVYVATETLTTTGDITTGEVSTGISTTLKIQDWSVLGWKATKPGGSHTGSVIISQGNLSIADGLINGGVFDIDMTSVKVLDIQNPKLEWEIRDEFFDAVTYPKASFVITKTENQGSGLLVYGDLTIKNITKSINFPATLTTSGSLSSFQANFAIDRLLRWLTMWEWKVNNYLEFDFNLVLN